MEALYVSLVDDEQCKHLTITLQKLGSPQAVFALKPFGSAIRNLKDSLSAQLNAGACLARMCTQVCLISIV